ncbi:MAG: hypothetical protein ACOYOA_15620, partial [Saprospiraceae bacterium]
TVYYFRIKNQVSIPPLPQLSRMERNLTQEELGQDILSITTPFRSYLDNCQHCNFYRISHFCLSIKALF